MGRWLDAFKLVIVSLFTRIRVSRSANASSSTNKAMSSIHGVIPHAQLPVIILPPPPSPSAPLMPDFEFRPSSDFAAALGLDVEFAVINPLDLMARRGYSPGNVLVVETSGPNTARMVMWFRYDSVALASRGVSVCRMFVDDNEADASISSEFTKLDWVGVCGWVMDRSQF